MSALLEFECRVSVDGYEVIDCPVGRALRPRSEQTRRFDLFTDGPSAYLEIAQTPMTEDGVRAFADRYGEIVADFDFERLEIAHPEARKLMHDAGDLNLIGSWFAVIAITRRLIEVWERSKRTGDFSKIIRAVKKFDYSYSPFSQVRVRLKKDPSSASARLCLSPPTLHAALLVQLILAIDGNLNLRGCIQCRKWFTLEAGRGRSDKEYCSNACRMRAYRKRKGTRDCPGIQAVSRGSAELSPLAALQLDQDAHYRAARERRGGPKRERRG
jgi:hypothetical protein